MTLAILASTAAQADSSAKGAGYFDYDGGATTVNDGPAPVFTSGPGPVGVASSFEGLSQYDAASFKRNFIPPDTMGAVGRTQFVELLNGAYAVYDKTTGMQTVRQSDNAFWAGAGQAAGTNGDSRVLFDKPSGRWIVSSFSGTSLGVIQIAVSNTSDATKGWRSTSFTGFNGIADFPTLAIDKNAVYIGTNDFGGPNNSFMGTTLNVLSLKNLLAKAGPTTTGVVQFQTPYNGGVGGDQTRGFAIQGVNSSANTTTGKILAVSIEANALTRYDVTNAGTTSAARTSATDFLGGTYAQNSPARQPSPIPANRRIVDSGDDRVGSSVWEVNGRIYSVHTVTPVGGAHTVVRYDVIDSATNQVLSEGQIGDVTHDYFQGSIAVNALGQVVIAYNRSGSGRDGKISILAQSFNTTIGGTLTSSGPELLLKVSDSNDYHNGSIDGQPSAGRQRWGDYSAVTIDPTSPHKFWIVGQYAREPNDPANGHPLGTGGTRWGTYISSIGVGSVPEPATWGMMIAGFGVVGAMQRRRRTGYATA